MAPVRYGTRFESMTDSKVKLFVRFCADMANRLLRAARNKKLPAEEQSRAEVRDGGKKKTSEFRSMNGPIQLDQTVAANNFWGLFHFGEARCSSRPARQQETAETCNRSADTTTRAFTSRKANCRCQPPGQPTGNNWPNSGFVLFFFRRTETSSDAQRTGGVRPIVAANDAIVCWSTNAPRLNARE